MKKEFIVNRQGKDFCLYEGLLDEAHQHGLIRISTTIVQLPTDANGREAVCTAEVEMPPKGESGQNRLFSGIGDASAANVGRLIVPHILRMAETRAKARALRDAVNVGATALEELADGDEQPSVSKPPAEKANAAKPNAAPSQKPERSGTAGGQTLVAVCEELARVRDKGENWMRVAAVTGNMLGIQIRVQRNEIVGLSDKDRDNIIETAKTQITQLISQESDAEPVPTPINQEVSV